MVPGIREIYHPEAPTYYMVLCVREWSEFYVALSTESLKATVDRREC